MLAAEEARTVFVYVCVCVCMRVRVVCALCMVGGPQRGVQLAICSIVRCSRAPLVAPARPGDTAAALV
eukprot:scaffold106182_cov36-Phaeocystis_antarctica.AAC.1